MNHHHDAPLRSANKDLQEIEKKMVINRKRKWGKPDADGVIEHIQ